MRDQLPHRGLEAWKWSDLRAEVAKHDPAGFDASMEATVSLPGDVGEARATVAEPDDLMGRIAAEYAADSVALRIPDGASYDRPLELSNLSQGNGRVVIEVGEGATLDVIERHDGESGFANLDIRYVVKAGGTLHRTVLSSDGPEMIRHVRAHVTLWDRAGFKQTKLTFGGAFSRLETRLACMGAVDVEMSGAYLLDGSRHADITHYIDFAAPGSTVRDAVAGVVTDKARGVFQGKFHVRRPAQQTDAEMRHDALMLSDTSRVNAKPELEIYADDVECAHGNTIGQLDENALFYMRQRGIPETQARALLIEAFVAARLGDDEDMLGLVRDWLAARA
ncbi:SufD family Fe-S cluster assembly protein [uncultured Algimonas sp.]|uniref:SufB/SufD family protein n=1 Tax=uncultured Algimonas sp. TaxID=1547920 RepID=UPI0026320E33|nr:SufD family Fe-S cluster assembly protein [uncultured Algimonas sp.]